MIGVEILRLGKNEIRAALELVWSVFLEFEAPENAQQGIDEFAKFIDYQKMNEQFDKGELLLWGCKIDGQLTGVIATRGINHICLLFVKKEFHRRGIAKKLFQAVEASCKGQGNFGDITVNSSSYAIEVYHRLGFVDTDKEQSVNGIRFTPMSYLLR